MSLTLTQDGHAVTGYDGMRILMCTVKFSPADLARAWGLGCDGYLTKPFDLGELLTTVAVVLGRSDEQNEAFRDEQWMLLRGHRLP